MDFKTYWKNKPKVEFVRPKKKKKPKKKKES